MKLLFVALLVLGIASCVPMDIQVREDGITFTPHFEKYYVPINRDK